MLSEGNRFAVLARRLLQDDDDDDNDSDNDNDDDDNNSNSNSNSNDNDDDDISDDNNSNAASGGTASGGNTGGGNSLDRARAAITAAQQAVAAVGRIFELFVVERPYWLEVHGK